MQRPFVGLFMLWAVTAFVATARGESADRHGLHNLQSQNQQSQRQQSQRQQRSVQRAQLPAVAVLGRVRQPGTYRIFTSRVALTTVIRSAGGLLSDAAKTVRVVRNGRVAFQSFLTPQSSIELIAGDLVIVSAARAPNHRVANNGVDLVLLNCADWPVVMRIRDRHATIGALTALLKQSKTVASTVRVIRTNQQFQRTAVANGRLISGDILIFNASVLKKSRLPELPKLYAISSSANSGSTNANKIMHVSGTSVTPHQQPNQFHLSNENKAKALLQAGRRDLANGRWNDAIQKVNAAKQLPVNYSLFADRPELLFADISKAMTTKRAIFSQPNFSQPNSKGHQQSELSPSSYSVSQHLRPLPLKPLNNKPPKNNGTETQTKQQSQTLLHKKYRGQFAPPIPTSSAQKTAGEPLSIPTIAEMDATDRRQQKTMLSEFKTNALTEKSDTEKNNTEKLAHGTVRFWVMVFGFSVVLSASWILFSMGRHKTADAKTRDANLFTTKRTTAANSRRKKSGINSEPPIFEQLVHNEIPIREKPIKMPVVISLTEPSEIIAETIEKKPSTPASRIIRYDAAHDDTAHKPQPHFLRQRKTATTEEPAAASTESVPDTETVPTTDTIAIDEFLVNDETEPLPTEETHATQTVRIDQTHHTPAPQINLSQAARTAASRSKRQRNQPQSQPPNQQRPQNQRQQNRPDAVGNALFSLRQSASTADTEKSN